MTNSGIYIHIPFCKSLCPYCDFYKVRVDNDLAQKYTEAVVKTTASFSHEYNVGIVDTVYFGGGTPSAIDGMQIGAMLDAVKENFEVLPSAEITVECNPSSKLEDFLPKVKSFGVNRISMGLQSASNDERRALGRMADSARVKRAVELCRENGIDNISLDVMLGVPGQTLESLSDTLDFCIDLGVPHISAYMLKLEEGTVFYKRQESLNLPLEDAVCDMYNLCCDKLDAAGIKQYEISNFAKVGSQSKHNLKYWHDEEYLGIGPAAHSFINGKRFYTKADLNSFLVAPQIVLDGEGGSLEERIMLGLRLNEGVKGGLSKDFINRVAENKKIAPFVETGEDFIRLNRKGFLVSNVIIEEIIELLD